MLPYLSIVESYTASPFLLAVIFAVIIIGQLGALNSVLYSIKHLVLKTIVAFVLYFAAKYFVVNYYNQFNYSLEVSSLLIAINMLLFGYLSVIALRFLRRNLVTFKNWYYLIPVFTFLGSKLFDYL